MLNFKIKRIILIPNLNLQDNDLVKLQIIKGLTENRYYYDNKGKFCNK
jgi:hypothetical protein